MNEEAKYMDTALVLFRLVIIPLAALLIMKLIPFGAIDMKTAVLIAAACPAGSNVVIFASQYRKDEAFSVECVCLSTILCLVTLPLMIMAAAVL